MFSYPRQLKNSASLQSGTLSHHQLLAAQAKAAANSTSSGKQAQGSATKTTGSGTQASSAAAVPKQPVTTPVSKPNSVTSAPRVAGNLQGSVSAPGSSATVKKAASSFYGRGSYIPAANQPVSPAVSAPNTISTQKAAVNLPVNTSSPAATPPVVSRPMAPTATKFVNIAPKITNASAVSLPTTTVQAVPGSSSAPTAGSLVTSASKGAGNPS